MHEVTTPELNRKKSIDADNQPVVSHNSSVVSELETSENIKPKFTTKKASTRKSYSYLEAAVNGNFHREVVSECLSKKSSKFSPRKISTCLQTTTNSNLSKKIR